MERQFDPRIEATAMLPILNAIVGHFIHEAAPLRFVRWGDTEQAITEVWLSDSSRDAEAFEEELAALGPDPLETARVFAEAASTFTFLAGNGEAKSLSPDAQFFLLDLRSWAYSNV